MKKSKLNGLVSALTIVFLCLFMQQAQAYPEHITKDTSKSNIRITRTNWMNTMGCTFNDTVCVSMWQDNSLVLKLVVQMALEDISDFPALHFRYIFFDTHPGGMTGTTAAVTNSMIEPVLLDNGDEAWQASFVFDIPLAELCDILDHFDFRIQYQLVTPGDGGSFIPYPTGFFPTLFPPDTFYIAPTLFSDVMEVKKEICCYEETYDCTEDADVPYNYVVNNEINHSDEIDRNSEILTDNSNALNTSAFNAIGSETVQQEKATLQIFPNPFSNDVQVNYQRVSESQHYNLTVFNAFGVEMFNKDLGATTADGNQLHLSTENWPAGIYYFYYFSGKERIIEKMIKQ